MSIHDSNESVADGVSADKQSHLEGETPATAEERVGYGRPPKAYRFAPGKSGNLGGRRKSARRLCHAETRLPDFGGRDSQLL
jgi:hypothetical protein